MTSTTKYLLGTSSALVLSAAAMLSAAQPANAAATNGLYFGGSTLASEAFRQIFDCYTGKTVGSDGFTFSSSFNQATPTPGLLPTTCTIVSTVQGMYAGVGSGNGFRGYISNNPAQWYGGSVTAGQVISGLSLTSQPPFPAAQPPFVDTLNASFGAYPYPRVDIGLSDSPLAFSGTSTTLTTVQFSFTPAGWVSGAALATSTVTVGATTQVVTYNSSSWGAPVQLPAFEVPVAIPVNLENSASLFHLNSQIKSGGNIVTGGAIQLSGPQLCAIFSGLVTDWNSTANIPTLSSTGTVVSQPFYYTNAGNSAAAQAYVTSPNSVPINVVYRSDGSGTSFILTNYLKTVCPLLDPSDSVKYKSIFSTGTKALPSTSFADVITNIVAARGNGPWNAAVPTTTTVGSYWVPATGSGGVQSSVGVTSTQSGRIGYVSADFVKPYAIASSAPYAAAVQNENQRIGGTIPAATATTLTFIAPTPTNADNAWSDAALKAPNASSTWADWNVYGIKFPSTEPTHGGVAVAGLPVLPLTSKVNAYPLSGTTFLAAYSCYGNDTNGQNLLDFLNWFYQNAGVDVKVKNILANNGFSQLNDGWLSAVQNVYLGAASKAIALASSGSQGCTGVTGGANP